MEDIIINKLKEISNSLNEKKGFKSFYSSVDRVVALTKKIYGDSHNPYILKLNSIKSDVLILLGPADIRNFKDLIEIIIDDLELPQRTSFNQIKIADKEGIKAQNNKIFIVHGHNEAMKQSVARVVEKLDLEPIILHERSNLGQTVIEKFLTNSKNVSFAIVLLSPDDLGYSIKDGPGQIKKRARQNVIFELGFFTANLGRNKVIALVEDANDFEIPSDIHGVVYIKYDSDSEKWKFEVAKELKESGYQLNLDKII